MGSVLLPETDKFLSYTFWESPSQWSSISAIDLEKTANYHSIVKFFSENYDDYTEAKFGSVFFFSSSDFCLNVLSIATFRAIKMLSQCALRCCQHNFIVNNIIMSMHNQEGDVMSRICSAWLYHKFNGKCILMRTFLRCQNWVIQILYCWEKRNQARKLG